MRIILVLLFSMISIINCNSQSRNKLYFEIGTIRIAKYLSATGPGIYAHDFSVFDRLEMGFKINTKFGLYVNVSRMVNDFSFKSGFAFEETSRNGIEVNIGSEILAKEWNRLSMLFGAELFLRYSRQKGHFYRDVTSRNYVIDHIVAYFGVGSRLKMDFRLTNKIYLTGYAKLLFGKVDSGSFDLTTTNTFLFPSRKFKSLSMEPLNLGIKFYL